MYIKYLFSVVLVLMILDANLISQTETYKVVDTGVRDFYNNSSIIDSPNPGDDFFGQDANYDGNNPSYIDNGDGTITDLVTGLMWEKDMGTKISYDDAFIKADTSRLGGHDDWRVPSLKELYSLILFTGWLKGETIYEKFIDTVYFNQPFGDVTKGERTIDAQTWSSTQYLSTTMRRDSTVFGVNFLATNSEIIFFISTVPIPIFLYSGNREMANSGVVSSI